MRQAPDSVWVDAEIPCFAVVGKVNMGKSAVLATLLEEDDDRVIRVSPEPGETTRCQVLSLVLDGAERLRFIDTPGFQRPVEAMRAIRKLHDDDATTPDLATLRRFVAQQRDIFEDECRLLEPLLAGAGVIYVIDPSVPVYDSFRAEIEILRWTGRPRLALLNSKHTGAADFEAAWREHLGTAFNLVRGFNAHSARFAARRQLLAALNQIEERHQANFETTMALLDAEWSQRREHSAETIVAFLRDALALREVDTYREDQAAPASARADAVARLSARYYQHVAALERDCSQALLAIHRHRALHAQTHAALSDILGADLNLARGEAWRRLGLTRRQLTAAGAAVGAGAGLGLDAAMLGHTLGLAALVGGIGGGALAFFKGDALPTLQLDVGGFHLGDGRELVLGPPRNPNFPWVLLDSVLLRYLRILEHTHGRRDIRELAATEDAARHSVVRELASTRQKTLARWFRRCQQGRGADDEAAALAALVDTLAEIERRLV